MKHVAKKRFGQNFLTDQSIIHSLIDSINPLPSQIIIEIGPGLGALTKPLLKKIHHLHVIEMIEILSAGCKKNTPIKALLFTMLMR